MQEPVTESVTEKDLATSPCAYQPLKLNYRVIDNSSPTFYQPQAKYPVSIQVPEVPVESLEIVKPDLYRGKSYVYNTQTPLSPITTVPIPSYNFDLYVPPSPTTP